MGLITGDAAASALGQVTASGGVEAVVAAHNECVGKRACRSFLSGCYSCLEGVAFDSGR